MTIYLYLKTHNKTGLKYFGKTTKDPFKYKGSGKYWLRHIAKHGNDVTTEIVCSCSTEKEARIEGLKYSKQWNIVESSKFANLIEEIGQGGATMLGKKHTPETIKKIKAYPGFWLGKKRGPLNKAQRKAISQRTSGENNPMFGKTHSKEVREKLSKLASGKTGSKNPMFGKKTFGFSRKK